MTRGPLHSRIERALAECEPTVFFERLSSDERDELQQRWRETFATRVKSSTGKWMHNGFDWHAFSYDLVYSREGARAEAEYLTRCAPKFLVLPHLNEDQAYRCESERLPFLRGMDAYVIDPEFTWTMVFTHEEDWCGPYFTTHEWAEHREATQTKRKR